MNHDPACTCPTCCAEFRAQAFGAMIEDEQMRRATPTDHVREDNAAMKHELAASDFTETDLGRQCVRGMLEAANKEQT